MAPGPAEAAAGSDLVLSLNSAGAAVEAALGAEPALAPGQVYADLNSAAPRTKHDVAAVVEPSGALFCDVALLAPVARRGLGTPALASGEGASAFVSIVRPLGMPVDVVDGGVGAAATRKLVRSVFMKGLAAAVLESMEAAERAGCAAWLRGELEAVLDGPGEPLVTRLLDGSRRHAARRVDEMQAACAVLRELGVEPRVAESAVGWLEALDAEAGRPA
jgi:3-hydroxyisobutyrate dehydrogenase-like beta-hydroxyacid dehydrogenase